MDLNSFFYANDDFSVSPRGGKASGGHRSHLKKALWCSKGSFNLRGCDSAIFWSMLVSCPINNMAFVWQLPMCVNLRVRVFRPVGTTDRSLAVYCLE